LGRDGRRAGAFPDWVAPALAGALLAAPRLGLGYFWDDYDFLTSRGTHDPFLFLLPHAGETFYRPIPQGVYAQFLRLVDPHSGLLGHALNLGLWVLAIALFVKLVTKLAGRRIAVFAGFALAATGAIPSLVAWISGSHDLLAIDFFLAAALFRDAGRSALAAAAAACAILSKESAVSFLPVLAFWSACVGRRPSSPAREALPYAALILAWAAIHPGIHSLLGRGLHAEATGYVGLEHPDRWGRYFVRYLGTAWNVPITGTATAWPAELTPWLIAALIVLVVGLPIAGVWRRASIASGQPVPTGRLVVLGLLLTVPALLLPTFLVRPWVPYLAAPAALGASLLLGVGLNRAPAGVAPVVLALFLALGVWCRGITIPGELVWSEPVLVDASQAIHRVESNFRTLRAGMPRGAQALVSVAQTGTRGINSTLVGAQALSVWYDDPSLKTTRPELRKGGAATDLLFRVTAGLDVVEIDPDQCLYRSTSVSLDPNDIGRPIVSYARGVAASGDAERSVRILELLARHDQGEFRSYDLRLAAMVESWAGNEREAARLLAAADTLPREIALDLMARVFGDPTARADLDSCAYAAFNISPDDPDALRYLIRRFRDVGFTAQAEHFEARLRRIAPADPMVDR
jgi:hypothetical protein